MKNVHIYVDVDLTLVDEMGRLLPKAVEGLLTLREAGCRLVLWSNAGVDYCRGIAERHEIAELFDAFLQKPDICIDDMPSTVLKILHYDVNEQKSWQDLADHIVTKHVDRPRKRE